MKERLREGCDNMKITTKEIQRTLDKYENIEEPIIVKRANKEDVVILSIKEYKNKILKNEIIDKLKKSEEEIREGKGIEADLVFEELRQKYEY